MPAFNPRPNVDGRTNVRMHNSMRSRRIARPWVPMYAWVQRVNLGAGEFTPDGDGDQTITLATVYPGNAMETNMQIMSGAYIDVLVDPVGSGLSALRLDVGVNGDDDALVVNVDAFGAEGTRLNSPTAAEYATFLPLAAPSPTLRIRPTGCNVDDLTAGTFDIVIPYSPLVQARSV